MKEVIFLVLTVFFVGVLVLVNELTSVIVIGKFPFMGVLVAMVVARFFSKIADNYGKKKENKNA